MIYRLYLNKVVIGKKVHLEKSCYHSNPLCPQPHDFFAKSDMQKIFNILYFLTQVVVSYRYYLTFYLKTHTHTHTHTQNLDPLMLAVPICALPFFFFFNCLFFWPHCKAYGILVP